MEHLNADLLDHYISELSAIEAAFNIYRNSGDMKALYALNRDKRARPILEKWLAFANMPELDQALHAMHLRTVSLEMLSPYRDIMLHCQTEWARPVSFIHIVYVYRGSFRCQLSGEVFTLEQGWCYMFNVGVPKEIAPAEPDSQLLNCLISQSYYENILLRTFDRNVFFSHFSTRAFYTVNSPQPMLKLDTTGNPHVRLTFAAAIVEQLNRNFLYETTVNSLISLLLVELLRIYIADSDAQYYMELGNNKLSDILEYIDNRCATVTLGETAEVFHFNPNYLSRIIKTNTGQTFTQLLQTIRLKKATMLLKSTGISVAEIAHLVGYQNLTHFYRLFRENYGISPAEYRETNADSSSYY